MPPGSNLLDSVSQDWEVEAIKEIAWGARVLFCRIGVVMGMQGGSLDKILSVFKVGLGIRFGSGRQWISWIHERDLSRIFLFLVENRDIKCPVNCTSPIPFQIKN